MSPSYEWVDQDPEVTCPMFPEGRLDGGEEGDLGSSPGSPTATPGALGRTFNLQHLRFFTGKTGTVPISGVACLDARGSVAGIKGGRVCPVNGWNGSAAEHHTFRASW